MAGCLFNEDHNKKLPKEGANDITALIMFTYSKVLMVEVSINSSGLSDFTNHM
jgi:hypothetical protein